MPSESEQSPPVRPFETPAGPGRAAASVAARNDGLLERGPELAAAVHAVDELVAAATAGGPVRGGILVYRGEPGIGKTALLAEIRRTAQDRCTVLTARGGETLTSVPFHLARQLLQPALDGFGAEEVRHLFGGHFDLLAPALGLAPPPSAAPADPQGVRDGLARLLDRLAERLRDRPLVLLVDDAQWADAESLDWLDTFTRIPREGRLPALVILAHRPLQTEPNGAGVPATLADIGDRAVLTLGLHALTPTATAALARDVLGGHADEPFCHELWTVTSGNPYETVELLAKVRDRMLEPVAGSAALLRDLGAAARGGGLVSRLEALGPGPTRLAWAIAVLDSDSTPKLLAELTGMPPTEVAEHTDRLRHARIVQTRQAVPPSSTDRLEFAHPLIATAVYGSVPPAFRTALHGRAAWALTSAGLGPAAVSRHLLEVHPDDDEDVVRQLRAAAVEHLAVGAPEAARRCLGRALAEPPGAETYAGSSTNSAARPCSPHPAPPSATCGPRSNCPASTTHCASTRPTGSPRPSPTTTSSRRPPGPPARRRPGPRPAPAADASRPRTSCSRASRPPRRTGRAAPAASPNSPSTSPAPTTPSVPSSPYGPSTG